MTTRPIPSLSVSLRGPALLHYPLLNKDDAFTAEERAALGLEGLLPSKVSTLAEQARRAHEAISRKSDSLEKYIGLLAIQDRNEHLFFRLLLDHVEEYLPIVYTPTVGLACQQFSHIYRRSRGVWITPGHRGRIRAVLANVPNPADVRLIVVTDNERILGLGDLGAGGIGIPIGKLTLYTAAAGIHPRHTLPISLDVGTDNPQLLDDDLYIGWRSPRLRGDAYAELVEEFVVAVRHNFPNALLQWEDFTKRTAFTLLDRYAGRLPSFNDDIQGTAAVAVAAMLSAARVTRTPIARQRVVILGAGAAGVGIARQLRGLFERHGLRGAELLRALAILDSEGLLHDGRTLHEETKKEVAWPAELARSLGLGMTPPATLSQVIAALEPTVLIGVSGQPDAFIEPDIRRMASTVERPVILPLSNPTSKCEARPADLLAWTDGRALVATGSPFEPVSWDQRTIRIGQANNVFVFPGVGLGALTARSPRVTDAMFTAAADALAAEVSDDDLSSGMLFPPLSVLRRVTARVAEAVFQQAVCAGLALPPERPIPEVIADAMWTPAYPTYLPG